MNLKSMILEEMDEDERKLYFSEFHLGDPFAMFSRIENPLSYVGYKELILQFLEHPNASKIGVRNTREWHSFFREEIVDNICNIIDIANSDRYKKRHFYLVFRIRDKERHKPAILYFDEHEERISVAKAFVPYYFEDMFRMKKTKDFYSENKAVSPWIDGSQSNKLKFLRMFK